MVPASLDHDDLARREEPRQRAHRSDAGAAVLGSRDNQDCSGDITVTYLWSGGGQRGTVDVTGALDVRTAPSPSAPITGLAADGAEVPIDCTATGPFVTGTHGTTNRWDRVDANHCKT
jgi:hypothetical protein